MVRKTDEVLETRRQDTHAGFVAAMALSIPLLLLISFIPTVFHAVSKRMSKSKQEAEEIVEKSAPGD